MSDFYAIVLNPAGTNGTTAAGQHNFYHPSNQKQSLDLNKMSSTLEPFHRTTVIIGPNITTVKNSAAELTALPSSTTSSFSSSSLSSSSTSVSAKSNQKIQANHHISAENVHILIPNSTASVTITPPSTLPTTEKFSQSNFSVKKSTSSASSSITASAAMRVVAKLRNLPRRISSVRNPSDAASTKQKFTAAASHDDESAQPITKIVLNSPHSVVTVVPNPEPVKRSASQSSSKTSSRKQQESPRSETRFTNVTRRLRRASSTVSNSAQLVVPHTCSASTSSNSRTVGGGAGCMPSTRSAIKRSVSFLEPLQHRLSRSNGGKVCGNHSNETATKQPKQMLWNGVLAGDIAVVKIALLRLSRDNDLVKRGASERNKQQILANFEQHDGFTLADLALLSAQPALLQLLLENGAKFQPGTQPPTCADIETKLVRLIDDAYQKYLYFSRLHETKLEMRGWKPSDEDEQLRIKHWKTRHDQFNSLLFNLQHMRQPQAPNISSAQALSPFSITVTVNLPKTTFSPNPASSLPASIFSTIIVEVAHSPSFNAASQTAIVARVEQYWTGRFEQAFHIPNLPEESRYFVRAACANPRATSSWCYMFDAISTIPWCGSAHDYVNLIPLRPWPDWSAFEFAVDDTASRLKHLLAQREAISGPSGQTRAHAMLGTVMSESDNGGLNNPRNVKQIKRRPSFSDNVRSLLGVHPIQTSDVVNAHTGLFIISLIVDKSGKRVLLARHSPPAIMIAGTDDQQLFQAVTSPRHAGPTAGGGNEKQQFAHTAMAPTTLHMLNLLALSQWRQTRDLHKLFSNLCQSNAENDENFPSGPSLRDKQHQEQLPFSILFRRNLLHAVCTLQTMLEMDDLGTVHHQLLNVGQNRGAFAVILIRQIDTTTEKFVKSPHGSPSTANLVKSASLSAPFFTRFRNFESCSAAVQQLLRVTNLSMVKAQSTFAVSVTATNAKLSQLEKNEQHRRKFAESIKEDDLFESGQDDFVHIIHNKSAGEHELIRKRSLSTNSRFDVTTSDPLHETEDDSSRARSSSYSCGGKTANGLIQASGRLIQANTSVANCEQQSPNPPQGLCLFYFDPYIDGANVVVRAADFHCVDVAEVSPDRNSSETLIDCTSQRHKLSPIVPYIQIRENAYLNDNDWRELSELFSTPSQRFIRGATTSLAAASSLGSTTTLMTDGTTGECYTTLQVEFLDSLRKLRSMITPNLRGEKTTHHELDQHFPPDIDDDGLLLSPPPLPPRAESEQELHIAAYTIAPLILNDKCTAIVVSPARQQIPHLSSTNVTSLSAPHPSSRRIGSGLNETYNTWAVAADSAARHVPLQLMQLNMQATAQPDIMNKWASLMLELETLSCIGRHELRRNYLLNAVQDREIRKYLVCLEELRIALLHATQSSANFLTHLLGNMRQQQLQLHYSQQQQQILRCYSMGAASSNGQVAAAAAARQHMALLPPSPSQHQQQQLLLHGSSWQVLPFTPPSSAALR